MVKRGIWGSDVRSDQPVGLEKERKERKEKEKLFISQCGGDAGAETHYTVTFSWPFTLYR